MTTSLFLSITHSTNTVNPMDSIASEQTTKDVRMQRKLLIMRGIAPLSAFTSLAISLITAVGISPSLSDINNDFYTHLTPKVRAFQRHAPLLTATGLHGRVLLDGHVRPASGDMFPLRSVAERGDAAHGSARSRLPVRPCARRALPLGGLLGVY